MLRNKVESLHYIVERNSFNLILIDIQRKKNTTWNTTTDTLSWMIVENIVYFEKLRKFCVFLATATSCLYFFPFPSETQKKKTKTKQNIHKKNVNNRRILFYEIFKLSSCSLVNCLTICNADNNNNKKKYKKMKKKRNAHASRIVRTILHAVNVFQGLL